MLNTTVTIFSDIKHICSNIFMTCKIFKCDLLKTLKMDVSFLCTNPSLFENDMDLLKM